ncbi:hypothetical protein M3B11_12180, partial [Brevibacterium sp. p3-SID960]|uniref:hypothetical protein n=1 Tax=Brevibacterium sp. p3-SID960 TaxID=2916063 RepID=UPI0021A8C8C7
SLCLHDMTTLYFAAEHEDELRRVGWAKEHRGSPPSSVESSQRYIGRHCPIMRPSRQEARLLLGAAGLPVS